MQFSLSKAIEILERTPRVLSVMLDNLSGDWIDVNEGENTWTAKEVVAHLIVCEKTDWLPRVRVILSESSDKKFEPIDMAAHFVLAKQSSIGALIGEFSTLRAECLREISSLQLNESAFQKTAVHPILGVVNLQQLLATWVTHDLAHIAQISRVMAKQNKENVGSFAAFLRILKS